MSSLLEGQYSEADSHNGFLEALNAWRNTGKTEEKQTGKKVTKGDVEKAWKQQQDPGKKGSFFANIESSNFNMGSIPTWQEGGTQAMASNKESCWQCYKLYSLDVETSEFKDGSKGFCSRKCNDKYTALNSKACQLASCNKLFIKEKGAFINGRWFCSETHGNQHPDAVRMREINSRISKPAETVVDDENFEIDL